MSYSILMALIGPACMPKTFPEDDLPVYEERAVQYVYEASYDRVWDATLEVLGLHARLDKLEKDKGYISTEWSLGFSDYIYKTYAGTRIPEPIRTRWMVQLSTAEGRTRVEIVPQEQVEKDMISANLEFRGSIYEWLDIPSSTSKERAVLDEILGILTGPSAGVDYSY